MTRHRKPRVDWSAIKAEVELRDGPCLALRVDVFPGDTAPDPCQGPSEFDHVTDERGRRIDAAAHGIAACSWHHRLSSRWRTDSKEHRAIERAYLASVGEPAQ